MTVCHKVWNLTRSTVHHASHHVRHAITHSVAHPLVLVASIVCVATPGALLAFPPVHQVIREAPYNIVPGGSNEPDAGGDAFIPGVFYMPFAPSLSPDGQSERGSTDTALSRVKLHAAADLLELSSVVPLAESHPSYTPSSTTTSVPEPSGLSILVIGVCALMMVATFRGRRAR